MFEVELRRSISGNMVVMKFPEHEIRQDFRYEMLQYNSIHGIFPIYRGYEEGNVLYSVEITGKSSLLKAYDQSQMNYSTIQTILFQLFTIIKESKEYLLDENAFLLDPQFIFSCKDAIEVTLCYCPGYQKDIREQLMKVMEFFMNQVNYKEEEAVRLVYQIYQMVREESCSIYQILHELSQQNITLQEKIEIPQEPYGQESIWDAKEVDRKPPEWERNEGGRQKQQEHNQMKQQAKKQTKQQVRGQSKNQSKNQEGLLVIGTIVGMMAILVAFYYSGMFYGKVGKQLDYSRVVGIGGIVFVCGGYLLWKAKEVSRKPSQEAKSVIQTEPPAVPQRNPMYSTIQVQLPTFSLVPKGEGSQGKVIPIHSQCCLGKEASQVDEVLPSNAVSRVHAELTEEAGALYVTDLHSTNGTFINRRKVGAHEKKQLQVGDELRFADLVYTISA